MTIEMEQVNYRSGVDYILVLKDARGNDIGWPDYDWSAKVYTRRRMCAVEVSCRGGVPVNCWNDNGRVHVALKDHRLEPGVMTIEFTAELPDGHFPDGSKPVAVPVEVGLELVSGAAPCPKQMEIELVLPYIKGDPLTWEDLTPEQMAELQRPAREAAEAFAPFARESREAEATRVANEETRKAQETARADAEAERAKAERLRTSAEELRVEAESGRVTAEEKRAEAEEKRATEFAGFEATIEGKQDKFSTSEGLNLENDVLSLTERAKQRLFDDLWRAAVGGHGKVDHGHVEVDEVERHYYLNEIWLTYEEAVKIMEKGKLVNGACNARYVLCGLRTVLPTNINYSVASGGYTYANSPTLEVLNCGLLSAEDGTFMNCTNLSKILAIYSVNNNEANKNTNTFSRCAKLKTIKGIVRTFPTSFSLADSPLLDLATFQLIVNKKNTSDISIAQTITVHPDVYSKLTDPDNPEWYALLDLASEKNITFATV